MSHFSINLFNHNGLGQQSLQDIFTIFGHQLETLGHTVEWRNDAFYMEPDKINILFEGFHPLHTPDLMEAKREGARFVVVATEEPTPKGFNHGLWPEMVTRYENFPAVAHFAEAIWYLVPGCGDWYGQFAPSALLELGYSPLSMRHHYSELYYDFGFYGSVTERRFKMLKRLASININGEKAKVRIISRVDAGQRDSEMSNCKVLLQLRAYDEMGLLSNSRCCTAMHLGRPVLAEEHANPGTWASIIGFQKPEHLEFAAVSMASNWRATYADQFRKYAALLSPRRCLTPALDLIGRAP